MNRDTVIQWAKEADLGLCPDGYCDTTIERLEAFARIAYEAGAKDERESAAKACEARYMGDNNREDMEARRCAAAIRARSTD